MRILSIKDVMKYQMRYLIYSNITAKAAFWRYNASEDVENYILKQLWDPVFEQVRRTALSAARNQLCEDIDNEEDWSYRD